MDEIIESQCLFLGRGKNGSAVTVITGMKTVSHFRQWYLDFNHCIAMFYGNQLMFFSEPELQIEEEEEFFTVSLFCLQLGNGSQEKN